MVTGNKEDLSDEEIRQAKHKFDELNKLMGKYDSAEKKAKWLNSPEYKQQIAEKKKKEAQAAREKILNDNMAKINEELQKTTKAEEAE